MGEPRIPNIKPLIQAGLNPKTGLPFRSTADASKDDIKKFLRVMDEQDAVNRYTWKKIPRKLHLTSQEIERFIYYKGQLSAFYIKNLDTYYLTPYALQGTIDYYGRYNKIHPVPFAFGTEDEKKVNRKGLDEYLKGVSLKVIYSIDQIKDKTIPEECAVLLHDYTKQLSETVISRQIINDPLLDVMAECVPYLNTSLLLGCGVAGLRVLDADCADEVDIASKSLHSAALNHQGWIPIIGKGEFQDLAHGNIMRSEEFMMAMQSLDNLRLSGYGLDNGGMFEKKEHTNDSENALNNSNVSLKLQDGLEIRKHFCEVFNALFGEDMDVEINQANEGLNVGDENFNIYESGGKRDASNNDSSI